MKIHCKDLSKLARLVQDRFPVLDIEDCSLHHTKIEISGGLHVNLHPTTGTVHFQGKDPTGDTIPKIEKMIEEVNAM